jgi:hypothetical protein
MKKCVVSFADGAGSYRKKLQRLEQSLKGNFDGDFLGFTDYKQIGSPHHSEIPYAFKPYAIQKAIDLGYELVVWMDSPLYCIKSINPVFDYLSENDYILFNNIGFSLGEYSSDKQLQHYGISRQDAWEIPQLMACMLGFNFNKEDVHDIFNDYKSVARELYPGSWDNDDLTESMDLRVRGSRHDQSCLSCIAHVRKLTILNAQQTFFAYLEHKKVMPIAQTVSIFSAG